jgi:hypothetical protein
MDDTRLCFLKQYINCNGNATWSYTGKRLEKGPQGFGGQWGDGKQKIGWWTLWVSQPSESYEYRIDTASF